MYLGLAEASGLRRRRLGTCPNPDNGVFPTPPTGTSGCEALFDEDFESGTNGWTGNLGATASISNVDHTSNYLLVSNRVSDWQGPMLEISDAVRNCHMSGMNYFFSAKIRLSKPAGGTSNCAATGNNCPIMKWNHMNRLEQMRSWNLTKFTGPMTDGTFMHWGGEFSIPDSYVNLTDIFAAITIVGPEQGVDIALDDFVLTSPPATAFPDPTAVCDNLIVNGDAQQAGGFAYPFRPFIKNENIVVKTDEATPYFSIEKRSYKWSSITQTLTEGCIRDGMMYHFSADVRSHNATHQNIVRVMLRRGNGSGGYTFSVITTCVAGNALGWVTCSADFTFKKDEFKYPPFDLVFITDDTAAFDWRSLSFSTITCGAISIGSAGAAVGCNRVVKVNVESQTSQSITLDVTNGTTTTPVSSTFISATEHTDTHWYLSRRTFSFTLPSDGYTGDFKLSGADAWPYFAEVILGAEPNATECPNFLTSFDVNVPPPAATYCDQVVRNGDFESGATVKELEWYHTGGGLKIANGVTGRALSTAGRTNTAHGLAQFLDTRCMVYGQKYEITAKVKMVYSDAAATGNPTCDPNTVLPGPGKCPRANIRTSIATQPTSYLNDVGKTLGPIVPGEWNDLFGSFRVTQEMVDADNVALYFEGPETGVDILLDDVSLVPVAGSTSECIYNGDFESGDTREWGCLGNGCGIRVTPAGTGYGNTGYAMETTARTYGYWGMTQELDLQCIKPDTLYEVNAVVKLKDASGAPDSCNPAQYYQGLADYCPVVKMRLGEAAESEAVLGRTTGPYDSNGWNKVYGVFSLTSAQLNVPFITAYIGWVKPNTNIVVDNVSIKPADANTYGVPDASCSNLVRNGDAEIGDTRFWHSKTPATGQITVVAGNGGGNAFRHHDRNAACVTTCTSINTGMFQHLPASCMTDGSSWTFSADFKLYDSAGTSVGCDSNIIGDCPMIRIEAFNGGGSDLVGTSLKGTSMIANQWNTFSQTFTVDNTYASKDNFAIFVQLAKTKDYDIDNIRVVPAV